MPQPNQDKPLSPLIPANPMHYESQINTPEQIALETFLIKLALKCTDLSQEFLIDSLVCDNAEGLAFVVQVQLGLPYIAFIVGLLEAKGKAPGAHSREKGTVAAAAIQKLSASVAAAIRNLGVAVARLDASEIRLLLECLQATGSAAGADSWQRRTVAAAIGNLSTTVAKLEGPAILSLVKWLQAMGTAADADSWERRTVIYAIGNLGAAVARLKGPAILSLVKWLQAMWTAAGADSWERGAVIDAIGNLGTALAQLDVSDIRALLQWLQARGTAAGSNPWERKTVAAAIVNISVLTTRDMLLSASMLLESLQEWGGEAKGVNAWTESWEKETVSAAIGHLGLTVDYGPSLFPLKGWVKVRERKQPWEIQRAAIKAAIKKLGAAVAQLEDPAIFSIVEWLQARRTAARARSWESRMVSAAIGNLSATVAKLEGPAILSLVERLQAGKMVAAIGNLGGAVLQLKGPAIFSLVESLSTCFASVDSFFRLYKKETIAKISVHSSLVRLFGKVSPMIVEAFSATKDTDLENLIDTFKNKKNITPILNFIQTNNLPVTQLNFDGWPIGGTHFVRQGWIQALAQCMHDIPSIHTLRLQGVGLNKDDVRILCQVLEQREAPLNVLIDESESRRWTNAAYSQKASKNLADLQQALTRNHTRAMLLGYALPDSVDRAALPLCRDMNTLHTQVTTLCTPPESYEVMVNGQALTLMNCRDANNNTTDVAEGLMSHYPGKPLFAQLNIDEGRAIEALLNDASWREEMLQARLGAEIIDFMMHPKQRDGSPAAMTVDEETQALLDAYETEYTKKDLSNALPSNSNALTKTVTVDSVVDHINNCLDDEEYPQRVQKGCVIAGINALDAALIQRLALTPYVEALRSATDLLRLEQSLKTCVHSQAVIKTYLQYVKDTNDVHVGFDGVVAYLALQGAGLFVYDPIPVKAHAVDDKGYQEKLTLVLQKSTDNNETYYLLKDPYAGYQRLWAQALTDASPANTVHAEALQHINVTLEGILRKIAACFTLTHSDSLKAFNTASNRAKALTSLHLYHLRASGDGAKNETVAKEQSLCAVLAAIHTTFQDPNVTPQHIFSALKQAVLDFLRLEGAELKALSSADGDGQALVRSVAGSWIFIQFAQQLFQVSKRIREAEQPQAHDRFDRKATFNAAFDRYFEARYVAAQAICSGLFKNSAVALLNRREKLLHCAGEFVLSALVAIPAYGALAHAGTATLHSLQALAEGVHAFEGTKHTLELGGELIEKSKVGHALHSAYNWASHKAWKFLLGSTLATEEMIKNLQHTFASSDDFSQKKNGLRDLLYHRYQQQLGEVQRADDMVVCAEALARHILDKIMLGVLTPATRDKPVLSKEVFLEAGYLISSYVTLKNAPSVKRVNNAMATTCDALYRQSGLVCMASKKELFKTKKVAFPFRWQAFVATPGEKYAPHALNETFPYDPQPDDVKYHVAGKDEVARLNELVNSGNAVSDESFEVANGIVRVSWFFSQKERHTFREKYKGYTFEVIPVKTTEDELNDLKHRIDAIEDKVEKLEDTVEKNKQAGDEKHKQLLQRVEQRFAAGEEKMERLQEQVETVTGKNEVLEGQNKQLQEKVKTVTQEKNDLAQENALLKKQLKLKEKSMVAAAASASYAAVDIDQEFVDGALDTDSEAHLSDSERDAMRASAANRTQLFSPPQQQERKPRRRKASSKDKECAPQPSV